MVRFLIVLLSLLLGVGVAWPGQVVEATPVLQLLPERPRVAVIDSGIARTPELEEALVAELDMAATPPRPPFQPSSNHGTMVATILVREASQPLEIISLRIDGPAGCPVGLVPPCQRDAEPIARAIRTATELGVSAINISLSLSDHPSIVQAVREAGARGIPVVLAAGNEGHDQPRNLSMARAAYPHAVLVGALDADGRPWEGSNRPHPGASDYSYVWRRGVAVPTVLSDGTEVVATGTSFAAPIETARLLRGDSQAKAQLSSIQAASQVSGYQPEPASGLAGAK